MKCSACSASVKPIVALDIDGTLGDYHRHFHVFASVYLGYHDDFFSEREYTGWPRHREWITEVADIDVRTFRDIKLAYRQGGLKRSMPVYRGAQDLTRLIRAAGAEIWLTTTRPYLRHDSVDPDTRFWLSHNGFEWDHMIYGEGKYEKLAEQVESHRVVTVLDDLFEELEEVQRVFGPNVGIQRGNLYNKSTYAIWTPREGSLSEAAEEILKRIREWRQQHA